MNKKIILLFMAMVLLTGCNKKTEIENDFGLSENTIYIKKLKCDNLVGKEIEYMNNKYIFSEGTIYEITNNMFSNNQQCKKKDNYDNYKIGDFYDYQKENKYYRLNGGEHNNDNDIHNELYAIPDSIMFQSYYYIMGEYDGYGRPETYKYYVLKKDGNIYNYEIYVKETPNGYKYSHKEIGIAYSSEDYGTIKSFYINEAEYLETFTYIISDKGFYTEKNVIENNCDKFEDVQCDKKLFLDENYEKIKKDVLYFDGNFLITNDYDIHDFYLSNYHKELELLSK